MVKEPSDVLNALRKQLADRGVDLEAILESKEPIRTIMLNKNSLRDSIKELSKKTRDQVVMVRIDEETSDILDAWIEAGTVKSRSEGAALFLKEGLKYHAGELEELKDELQQLKEAREKLQQKAKKIFDEKIKNGGSKTEE